MDAVDADLMLTFGGIHHHVAITGQGEFELRDLVAFGEIGVEIVLTGKNTGVLHFAVQRQSHFDAVFDCHFVNNRQSTRHAGTNRAYAGVRFHLGCINDGAGAEHFGGGRHLCVNFESNYSFILHNAFYFIMVIKI
ncbi:hypothetical protein SDC9_145013 [bioreactor metagenome]|uniref:Uncharacterized protein n=1 Tax=bioreactor metagenome TaxID=1076179 RepID=A0A645EAI8_9ZZZZ